MGNYIEETPMEEFVGDEFVILSYMAQGKTMGDGKSMKLVTKLFDSLEHLKHPVVFNAIVSLILTISCELSGASDNYVMKMCGSHPSSRYIEETLIQLINKPNPDFLPNYLQFAIDAFTLPETREHFFYINDVNVLLEALLRDIDNTKTKDLRMQYLALIKTILEYPEYLKFKHKWTDALVILSDMGSNADLDKDTVEACGEIVKYMEAH